MLVNSITCEERVIKRESYGPGRNFLTQCDRFCHQWLCQAPHSLPHQTVVSNEEEKDLDQACRTHKIDRAIFCLLLFHLGLVGSWTHAFEVLHLKKKIYFRKTAHCNSEKCNIQFQLIGTLSPLLYNPVIHTLPVGISSCSSCFKKMPSSLSRSSRALCWFCDVMVTSCIACFKSCSCSWCLCWFAFVFSNTQVLILSNAEVQPSDSFCET